MILQNEEQSLICQHILIFWIAHLVHLMSLMKGVCLVLLQIMFLTVSLANQVNPVLMMQLISQIDKAVTKY